MKKRNLSNLKQIQKNNLISLSKFKLLSYSALKICNFLCLICTQPVSDVGPFQTIVWKNTFYQC